MLTIFGQQIGRLLGFLCFVGLAIYSTHEFTRHFQAHKITKIFIPFLVLIIILANDNIFSDKINDDIFLRIQEGANYDNAKNIFKNLTSIFAIGILMLLLLTLWLDPIVRNNKNFLNTYIQSVFVIILIGSFYKLTFLIAIVSYKFILLLVPLPIFSDSFSYLGAQILKQKFPKKVAPRISPNKTWIGIIVGIMATMIYLGLFLYFTKIYQVASYPTSYFIFLMICLPLIAPLGDLTFSLCKRQMQIKDFGKLIPGHGGLLDRIDAATFIFFVFILISQILI